MTESGREISFRLRVRRDIDPNEKRTWLYVPLNVGQKITLAMVPNTVATQSVITPSAADRLRENGLLGADIVDLKTGRASRVLRDNRLAGQHVPDLEVRVRDVTGLRSRRGDDIVDGYLGLDFFFGHFRLILIDTRTLRITLRTNE